MKHLRMIFLLLWALVSMARAQAPLPDGFSPAANGAVYALAVQGDGKTEGSSDLMHWTPFYTNTVSSGGRYFGDAGWEQMFHRFYRARLWK